VFVAALTGSTLWVLHRLETTRLNDHWLSGEFRVAVWRARLTIVEPICDVAVAEVFDSMQLDCRVMLLAVRDLIMATAEKLSVGPLLETLKWGEPAYLTPAKSGTTIRLNATRDDPSQPSLLFNCKTNLVSSFRSQFPKVFEFRGDRQLVLDLSAPLPTEELRVCIAAALTYHQLNRK
jgi:hypothetical protein